MTEDEGMPTWVIEAAIGGTLLTLVVLVLVSWLLDDMRAAREQRARRAADDRAVAAWQQRNSIGRACAVPHPGGGIECIRPDGHDGDHAYAGCYWGDA